MIVPFELQFKVFGRNIMQLYCNKVIDFIHVNVNLLQFATQEAGHAQTCNIEMFATFSQNRVTSNANLLNGTIKKPRSQLLAGTECQAHV